MAHKISRIHCVTIQTNIPQLSATGITSMSTLLYPLVWLFETLKSDHLEDTYVSNKLTTLPNDVHLVTASLILQRSAPFVGLVLHKTQTAQCYRSEEITGTNDINAVNDVNFLLFSTKISFLTF